MPFSPKSESGSLATSGSTARCCAADTMTEARPRRPSVSITTAMAAATNRADGSKNDVTKTPFRAIFLYVGFSSAYRSSLMLPIAVPA